MIISLQVMLLFLMAICFYTAIRQKKRLLIWLNKHQTAMGGMIFLTLLYWGVSWEFFGRHGFDPSQDNFIYGLPTFSVIWQSIAETGEFPWWNPFLNGGEPTYLYFNHMNFIHLPHLIMYSFIWYLNDLIDVHQGYFLMLLLGHFFSAFGMFLLLLKLFEEDMVALFGFFIMLFSGSSVVVMNSEHYSATLAYAPWIILTSIHFFKTENPKWFFLTCGLFAYSLTIDIPHIIVYFYGFVGLSLLIANPDNFKSLISKLWNLGWKNHLAGVLLILIIWSPSAMLFLEYFKYLESPTRGGDILIQYQYIEASKDTNSMSPHTLLYYLFPTAGRITGLAQSRMDNYNYYLGITTLLFAAYGLFSSRTRYRNFLLIQITFVIGMGIGGYGFFYYLFFQFFPFAPFHRLPVQFSSTWLNPLIITLACSGLATLLNNKRETARSKDKHPGNPERPKPVSLSASPEFFLVISALICAHGFLYLKMVSGLSPEHLEDFKIFTKEFLMILFAVAVFSFLVFVPRNKLWALAFILILVLDNGQFYLTTRDHQRIPSDPSLTQREIKPAGFYDNQLRNDSPWGNAYFGSLMREHQYNQDKTLMVLKRFKSSMNALHARGIDRVPIVQLTSPEITRPGVDFWGTYLAEAGLRGFISEIREHPNRKYIKLKVDQESTLVRLANFDPGWSATIDGREVPIKSIDAFQGIDISPGEHEVVFNYLPRIRWSGYLSLLALTLLISRVCLSSATGPNRSSVWSSGNKS